MSEGITPYKIKLYEEKSKLLKEVYEKFKCEHNNQEVREITYKNGSKHYVYQCLRCGNSTNGIKKESIQGTVNKFDDNLAINFLTQRNQEIQNIENPYLEKIKILKTQIEAEQKKKEKEQEDLKEKYSEEKKEWEKWYQTYLQSTEWKEKREKVLLRAQGICEGCRENKATVVHHLNYKHVGDELLFELVALCEECHYKVHKDEIEDNSNITKHSSQ